VPAVPLYQLVIHQGTDESAGDYPSPDHYYSVGETLTIGGEAYRVEGVEPLDTPPYDARLTVVPIPNIELR
jgi:hypothetical protein